MNRKVAVFVLIVAVIATALVVISCQRETKSEEASTTDFCGATPAGDVVEVDVSTFGPTTEVRVSPGYWMKWTIARGADTVVFDGSTRDLFGIEQANVVVEAGSCTWTRVQDDAPLETAYRVRLQASPVDTVSAGPIIIICPPGKECETPVTREAP